MSAETAAPAGTPLEDVCGVCACARFWHETRSGDPVACRGHHLSGGSRGMVQQCGCAGFRSRVCTTPGCSVEQTWTYRGEPVPHEHTAA